MKTIEEILSAYPEFLSVNDILKLGIFNTRQAFYMACKKGKGPPVFNTGDRKMMVAKQNLIEWINQGKKHV